MTRQAIDRAALRERLQERQRAAVLDASIVTSPANLRYLFGISVRPRERVLAAVVPSVGAPTLVVPRLEADALVDAVADAATVVDWEDGAGSGPALLTALDGLPGHPRLAVEKSHLSVAGGESIAALARVDALADCSPLLEELRLCKSEAELARIREAARIASLAVDTARDLVVPGTSEEELARACVESIRREGAELPAAPRVLSGARTALPHGGTGERTLLAGDLVMVDVAVAVDGYCADLTRTVVVGDSDERHQELHDLVRRAHQSALDAVSVGARAAEVDEAARAVIRDGQLEDHFLHRVGHGLGLELHEPPYLSADCDAELSEGMVMTIEPGVYLPGLGGVRIEDDVVLGPDGPDVLTCAHRALGPA